MTCFDGREIVLVPRVARGEIWLRLNVCPRSKCHYVGVSDSNIINILLLLLKEIYEIYYTSGYEIRQGSVTFCFLKSHKNTTFDELNRRTILFCSKSSHVHPTSC